MAKHVRLWKIVTVVACCMFSTLSTFADDNQGGKVRSFELRPGVVVDLEKGRVFLMHPKKSIEAVNIADGKTLWNSTKAAKPLAFSNGLLVSQLDSPKARNNLNLVVLDVEKQGEQVSASSISLPQRVNVMVDDGPSARFSANAVAMDDDSFIFWGYQQFPLRGMPRLDPADPNAPSAFLLGQQPRGTIKVDLRSGEVSEVQDSNLPPSAMAARPKNLTSPPGTAAKPNQRLSIDRRYTLKSKRIADDRKWEKYEWTILDSESNKQVGKLKSHLSQSAFVVVDSLIIFETGAYIRRIGSRTLQEPLMIRAIDLETGRQLWSRPVRDTKYRGTLPP